MSIYLRQFETQSAYEAAENELILPNVSLTIDNNVVHYKSNNSTPTPTHDYVEIGGLKWATMNIGANSVTDTGLYFQWGDTQGYTASQAGSGEGQKYFSWEDYKWTEDGGNTLIKYTCSESPGSGNGSGSEGDGFCELLSSDDAVTAAWGGSWRMPTTEEYIALGDAVDTEWTTDYQGSGVMGMICTDKTDSSKVLFFPAAGYCYDGNINYVGDLGNYWSSSFHSSNVQNSSYNLNFYEDVMNWQDYYFCCYGFPVRGVTD